MANIHRTMSFKIRTMQFVLAFVGMYAPVLAIAGLSDDDQNATERIERAVVEIMTPDGRGLGVVINARGDVLTVTTVTRKHDASSIDLRYRDGSRRRPRSKLVLNGYGSVNLVILRADRIGRQEYLKLSSRLTTTLEKVQSVTSLGGVNYSHVSGELSRISDDSSLYVNIALDSKTLGAPICSLDGSLIGIVREELYHEKQNAFAAISASDIRSALTNAKIPYEMMTNAAKGSEDTIAQLIDSVRVLESRRMKLDEQLLAIKTEFADYRDSVRREMIERYETTIRLQEQITSDSLKLVALRDDIARYEAERARLQRRYETDKENSDRLETDIREQRAVVEGLLKEEERLKSSIRELEGAVAYPRMRFDARISSGYQSLTYNEQHTSHLYGRGEIGLGGRLGVNAKSTSSAVSGDVLGVYIAATLTNNTTLTAESYNQSYDWGAFLELNNNVRVQVGVGASNQEDVPALSQFIIGVISLKFSGTELGAWGINARVIKTTNQPTYNVGAGIWFAFGSNFLQL